MKKTFLIFILFVCQVSKADVPNSERQALIAIYFSTDGPNWTAYNHKWNTSNPVSTWTGVTVTYVSGIEHVTKLSTTNLNGTSGYLPSEIGNLTYLNELNCNDSNLSGSIPNEIGNLINLTQIRLNQNNLSGSIPSTIGNLINLTHLIIYNNNLTGTIPPEIINCSHLKNFLIDFNNLTGNLPSFLSNLTEIESFWISGNDFTGAMPNIFTSWPNLVFIGIDDTLITGNLDLSTNTNLIMMYGPHNALTSINIKNGNNGIITTFDVINSPNLNCIQVDNATNAINGIGSYSNWQEDNSNLYSENCSLLNTSTNSISYLTVYPNPTSDIIFINGKDIINAKVFNTLGEIILSKNDPHEINKLDISQLNSGIYFLKVQNIENESQTIKIIKE